MKWHLYCCIVTYNQISMHNFYLISKMMMCYFYTCNSCILGQFLFKSYCGTLYINTVAVSFNANNYWCAMIYSFMLIKKYIWYQCNKYFKVNKWKLILTLYLIYGNELKWYKGYMEINWNATQKDVFLKSQIPDYHS